VPAMRVVGQCLWSRRHWAWPLVAVLAPLTVFNYQWSESLDWAIFAAVLSALVCAVFGALPPLRHAVPAACFGLAVFGMLLVIALAPITHMENRGKERVFTDVVVRRLNQPTSNPQP